MYDMDVRIIQGTERSEVTTLRGLTYVVDNHDIQNFLKYN